jgi:hypothetical protein
VVPELSIKRGTPPLLSNSAVAELCATLDCFRRRKGRIGTDIKMYRSKYPVRSGRRNIMRLLRNAPIGPLPCTHLKFKLFRLWKAFHCASGSKSTPPNAVQCLSVHADRKRHVQQQRCKQHCGYALVEAICSEYLVRRKVGESGMLYPL